MTQQPRYHHQEDVIGFCGDMRHPWGCLDDGDPVGAMDLANRVDELPSELRKRVEALEERLAALERAAGLEGSNGPPERN